MSLWKRSILALIAVIVLLGASVWGYRHWLVAKMERHILQRLTDPESAQFRDVLLFAPWKIDGASMCGEVNAKNRLGGYAGPKWFVVRYHEGQLLPFVWVESLDDGAPPPCIWGKPEWWWIRW